MIEPVEKVRCVAQASTARATSSVLATRLGDRVVHEGSLENSASLLLRVPGPVAVVHGRQSNLAFGATFPEAREIFWDPPRLQAAWQGPERCFLVSAVAPSRSVVKTLAPVHLIAHAGGRCLHSNRLV